MSAPQQDPALGLDRTLDEEGRVVSPVHLAPPQLLELYQDMLRIRRIDEIMLGRQRQGRVGFYGTITGQEAVPIGAAHALEAGDWVFPALRESSIMLVRGFPLAPWLAQVYGNDLDVLKGRQMPSHQSGRSVHQVSWSSCIGPQLPQAVGAAWAAKLRGDRVVTVGFLGDGATSQPDFHAALNFAGVFRVPCVIVCQNNHWSISVPTSRQTASETLAVKAHAYGIRGLRVDGNDVVAVHRVIREAAARAREHHEPTFVEAVTYRMGPHSSSDNPTRYRSEEEVAGWRARDPIERIEKYLSKQGLANEGLRQRLLGDIDRQVHQAIAEIEAHGDPARESLFEDVFGRTPWHLQEQRSELMNHPAAPRGHR